MPAVQVTLTDDERRQAEARARELGYASLEAYAAALVRAGVELPVSDELEAELLAALRGPARELTPADWDEKRRRPIAQHGQAKAGVSTAVH